MTLDAALRQVVEETVRSALERDLPAYLARAGKPVDPDLCRSIKDTAEYLGVTVSCIRERIKRGELETIPIGKYVLIPHRSVQDFIARQLDRQRFARDQASRGGVSDMDDEINEALGLTSPSKRGVRSGRKEPQAVRRA